MAYEITKNLQSENIVKYYGFTWVIQPLTNNDPHIVQIKPAVALERVFGLDFNAILNILGPLTEPQALYFFKPLVNTLI